MTKVCVVTGGRMDYGHLHKVMKAIDSSSILELQIIATCMHLSPEFGLTFKRIEDDGFKINKKSIQNSIKFKGKCQKIQVPTDYVPGDSSRGS